MLTKMKLALVLCGCLMSGVAVADTGKPDFAAKHAEMKAKMLARFDTNKDGKLDKAEREAMRDTLTTERFQKLDTNKDGQLSLAEFKAGQMKHHRHARRFGGKGRGGAKIQ